MAVYLGDAGLIEIRRDSLNVPLTSVLNTTDVNVAKRRFSFDFEPEALITGDRLFITTTDRSPLVLVAGHDYPDGYWYCHVDQVGGIRLYEFFEDAVNGGYGNALALIEPTVPQSISVDHHPRKRGHHHPGRGAPPLLRQRSGLRPGLSHLPLGPPA